ncbi:olfactory receptor 11G2-like [Elephas maximus indicus]|uniref:olfactory receptor 11G2-like n=1 Tax=Elephas maximus indicus TaxID=99487 RepID=UPI0021160623|nr:olfactory receptor 11G2-like [Elephas maximus indicus]
MKIFNTPSNSSTITGFILLGFPSPRQGQIFLFVLFSIVYLLTLMGNGSIICAVCWGQRLHTAMYILLVNFSFLEICYVTPTVLNMLVNFLSETKIISFSGCFLQFYFFFSLGSTECLFLAAMAFDQYLAICRPLCYPTIITGRLCTKLAVSCWVFGFLWFLIPIIIISQMSFCGSRIIDHFLCDPGPLLALTCKRTAVMELALSTLKSSSPHYSISLHHGVPHSGPKSSTKGPLSSWTKKTFSTCGSHLAVVSLFCGSVLVIYGTPTSQHEDRMHKIVTLFYSL